MILWLIQHICYIGQIYAFETVVYVIWENQLLIAIACKAIVELFQHYP